MEVGKGREQDAVSFTYMEVGKGREQDAVDFYPQIGRQVVSSWFYAIG